MQFPKLTPLQSRFAATLIATVFLIALYYILLTNPGSFAYALDVEHRVPVDLASPLLIEESPPLNDGAKAAVIRRAPSGTASLGNNQFQLMNINLGETQYWVFPKEAVLGPTSPPTPGLPAYIPANTSSGDVVVSHGSELKKRDDTETFDEDIDDHGGNSPSKRAVTVYISMNTCLKPSLNTTASTASQNTTLPALQVYISKSTTLQKPGPGVSDSLQSVYSADGGYMAAEISADDDVYIAVSAPNSTAYSGIYNYQLAASIDAYFHAVEDTVPNLFFVDSDVNSALLVTDNTTQSAPNSTNYQQWMNLTPPYTIFANNINNTATAGLERSFCALNQLAQLRAGNTAINVGMTNRGLGNQPKEQFYVTNLNGSSTYYGILGMKGNSTAADNGVVGGGGKVWRPMNFTTKADDNCALLYNLDFCSEVAYAVPSNPSLNSSRLQDIYDTNARNLYQNFNLSLSLIPCNTSSTSMYSLAVGCGDCAASYKQWLCAVTIPRCADFSSTQSFLQPRNVGQAFLNGTTIPASDPLTQSPVNNASRNALIDDQIKPGPYKEILPCTDLCNDLVRTCPAALGFRCPSGALLNASYGFRDPNGDITCSYLGAAYYLNDGSRSDISSIFWLTNLAGFWLTWTIFF